MLRARKLFALIAIVSVISIFTPATAEYLPIQNPGFEDQALANNSGVTGVINSWTVSGTAGVFDWDASVLPDQAPEGENTAFFNAGGEISQIILETIQADSVYSLIMEVGDRLGTAFGGYTIELRAGASVIASISHLDAGAPIPPGDGFTTVTVNYEVQPADPAIGNIISIFMSSPGTQTELDAVRLVRLDAADAIENLTSGDKFASIQAAVDAALDGEIIEIPPDTYHEHVDLKGKSITLRSRSGDPNDTIIDGRFIDTSDGGTAFGSLDGMVVLCNSNEDPNTVIDSLTISNGNGRFVNGTTRRGGGLYCEGSTPRINQCYFMTNTATEGGASYNLGASPTYVDCLFEGNIAANFGGGMRNFNNSNPTIADCRFIMNSATNFSGGAIINGASSPVVNGSLFEMNSCGDRGGGYEDFGDSHSRLTDCTFLENEAGNDGGAMMIHQNCNTVIVDCHFEKNSCPSEGGAINMLDNCNALVTGCTFLGNQAVNGGAITNRDNCSPVVGYSHFLANRASGSGGALFDINASSTLRSEPVYQHCRFIGNWCNSIGGVSNNNDFADALFSHCVFLNNRANTQGGALLIDNCRVHITNCIARDNVAASNKDFEVNVGAEALVRHCDVAGTFTAGFGNIDADPLFVSAPDDGGDGFVDDPATNGVDESDNNDYGDQHLTAGSPCIDAGISLQSAAVYLDGNFRAIDDPATVDSGFGPVTYVDMGVYEFQTGQPCNNGLEGDVNCDGVVNIFDFILMAGNWLAGT